MVCRSFDDEVALTILGNIGPRARALPTLMLAGALVLTLLTNQSAAEGVPIEAQPEAPSDSLVLRRSSFVLDACRLIDRVARSNAIPGDFVARLISIESGFSPTAVSPKGAQGIAQFMPETARLRGLADPFEPGPALKAAIEYLSDLRHRFGNLGLAAAAYNAGEKRVEALIAGTSSLPLETRNYVFAITGRQIEDWLGVNDPTAPFPIQDSIAFVRSCSQRVTNQLRVAALPPASAVFPWGVQIFESFSRNQVVNMFLALQERLPGIFGSSLPMVIALRNYSIGTALRQRVYLGAASRREADNKCAALLHQGVACLVRRTGR
jgi:hypothetical protein